jgi:hypothetical protein
LLRLKTSAAQGVLFGRNADMTHDSPAHYNRERPHRGLALLSPEAAHAVPPPTGGEVKRRDRLGGLIHEYHRAAA